jgi:hypothetical protein
VLSRTRYDDGAQRKRATKTLATVYCLLGRVTVSDQHFGEVNDEIGTVPCGAAAIRTGIPVSEEGNAWALPQRRSTIECFSHAL